MKLRERIPLLRWSFWRMAAGMHNINRTGQIGDGRESAAVRYVLAHARKGDVADVIATIDRFAYTKSFLVNVGDEKGRLLDAAVSRANPSLALELGTYLGYGALRIAAIAPAATICSVELAQANAETRRAQSTLAAARVAGDGRSVVVASPVSGRITSAAATSPGSQVSG